MVYEEEYDKWLSVMARWVFMRCESFATVSGKGALGVYVRLTERIASDCFAREIQQKEDRINGLQKDG